MQCLVEIPYRRSWLVVSKVGLVSILCGQCIMYKVHVGGSIAARGSWSVMRRQDEMSNEPIRLV